jgi:homopolymeric O-antigen transport system ATP-binding protein
VIEATDVYKVFRLFQDPKDRLKEILFRKRYSREFTALKGVSFGVKEGEVLGVIGENGAGKSTLLKILTGILLPTSGHVVIEGRATGLLELGTGFNSELSGRKNIYMNGMLIGMSREELDDKLQRIIDFAELGDFIDEPLKTYSSGMTMRLAFAVAIHAEPAAFVVDEALSVGDAYFQQKCMKKIREFRDGGGSIVFVSHDLNAVKMLCDRALLLSHGEVVEEGEPEKVANTYNFLLSKVGDKGSKVVIMDNESGGHGTLEAVITAVTIIGDDSRSEMISAGEHAAVLVEIEAFQDYDDITSGILIRDRFGQDIFGTNLLMCRIPFSIRRGCRYVIEYRMKMNLGPGRYTISAAVHQCSGRENYRLHWVDRIALFEVAGVRGNPFIGVCRLDPAIEVREVA